MLAVLVPWWSGQQALAMCVQAVHSSGLPTLLSAICSSPTHEPVASHTPAAVEVRHTAQPCKNLTVQLAVHGPGARLLPLEWVSATGSTQQAYGTTIVQLQQYTAPFLISKRQEQMHGLVCYPQPTQQQPQQQQVQQPSNMPVRAVVPSVKLSCSTGVVRHLHICSRAELQGQPAPGAQFACKPWGLCTASDRTVSTTSSNTDDTQSQDVKQQLLEKALFHVPVHGWSHSALVAAAKELNLSPAVVGLLRRKESELVEFFITRCNSQLKQELNQRQAEFSSMKTQQRIFTALQIRLSMLKPYIENWPQALAILSTPGNLPHSLKLLWQMIDDIWYAAGDTSTDSSWYTKRALLAAVYTATEIYMLTDYSPNYSDTWAALERRLQDVEGLGRASRSSQNYLASILRSVSAYEPPTRTPPA